MDNEQAPAVPDPGQGSANIPGPSPARAAPPAAIPLPIGQRSRFLSSTSIPSQSSPQLPSPRKASTPLSITRSARDYFARPPEASSSTALGRSPGSLHPPNKEWTVFGQLLEDDRTPRLRGSDTHIHSIRRRSSHTPALPSNVPPSSSFQSSVTPNPQVQGPLPASPGSARSVLSHGGQPDPHYFQEPVPFRRPSISLTDDHEYDSMFSDSESETTRASSNVRPKSFRPQPTFYQHTVSHLPTLTPLQRSILKCTLAYFIGSLFTYWPFLSGLISDIVPLNSSEGPSPSGHMVATVIVYFNPAKTIGAMVEADTYCLVAAVFSSAVCLASFALFWFFEERPGLAVVADVSVFICLGLAMAAVAWSKNWMERPSFNTACSMASIIIFIVVVREGGAELLIHVLFIVLVGSAITNLVCFSLWRQSAATNLQTNMAKVLNCFATLLDMTTQTFLLQENYHPNHDKLLRAVEEHQKSFTSLKNSLSEAKSEWYDSRIKAASRTLEGSGYDLYDAAVEGLTRIAQHLNGLRDGTRLQFEMAAHGLRSRKDRVGEAEHPTNGDPLSGKEDESVDDASTIFQSLIDDVGPPLDALAHACISCLKRMRTAFGASGERRGTSDDTAFEDFGNLAKKIERALFTFERTSNQAVLRFFRKTDENEKIMDSPQRDVFAFDQNESVFLMYFFIFTLQEFARELSNLTEVMGTLKHAERQSVAWSERSWIAKLLGKKPRETRRGRSESDLERPSSQPPIKTSPQKTLRSRLSTLIPSQKQRKQSPFPKIRPHAPNTIHTPSRSTLSVTGRLQQKFWEIGARLKETDLKYAIKCGIATSMLASPALFESTREQFLRFRGEWAMISFFVVLSPTVGQTNFLSLGRILGTMLGATTAATIYTLFPHNPYVLSVFGAVFSIPCFYYIVSKPQYATSGRFVLLTYNLTALFCFNSRQNAEIDIIGIALRRFTAVSVGVIWAIIVSRWWWPAEARRELTQSLSDFCLNLGWLYTKLVETYSVPPGELARLQGDDWHDDEGTHRTAADHLTKSVHHFMAMELHLQLSIIKLQTLLVQTQHEPRLKGPFPVHLYRTILTSLQVILDKLHSMRCVTTREEWYTTVRKDFIIPVNGERREMVGNVILYFSTLASAFTLKRAMPPYLPPAEDARQRLVDAIRQLDIVKRRDVRQSHHLLYFAYALMMKGVIQELDFLGQTLQEAFGVIGQSVAHFEELFRERPGETPS